MVAGDLADVVSRACDWHIYSHPCQCAPGFPLGWKVVKWAQLVRDSKNDETLRESARLQVGSRRLTTTCLLDDRHIKAELAVLANSAIAKREVIGTELDVREYLESEESHSLTGARWHTVTPSHDEGPKSVQRGVPSATNLSELLMIAADAEGTALARAAIAREVIWEERARTYATGRYLVVADLPLMLDVPPPPSKHARNRKRSHKGSVNLWDGSGRAEEWALYAGKQLARYILEDWPWFLRTLGIWTTPPRLRTCWWSHRSHPHLYAHNNGGHSLLPGIIHFANTLGRTSDTQRERCEKRKLVPAALLGDGYSVTPDLPITAKRERNEVAVESVEIQDTESTETCTARFGLCPVCRKTDGYMNVGSGHWFMCIKHKNRWFIGSNLFSSWKDETEEEQQDEFYQLGFGDFADVEPYYHPAMAGR
jgi:hypothetical protein